jgi:hypothetical protein
MRAFFEARVEHLSADDRVKIECDCRRGAFMSVKGLGLPGRTPISDLKRRLRCENCGERGKVDLTVIWADAPNR